MTIVDLIQIYEIITMQILVYVLDPVERPFLDRAQFVMRNTIICCVVEKLVYS